MMREAEGIKTEDAWKTPGGIVNNHVESLGPSQKDAMHSSGINGEGELR